MPAVLAETRAGGPLRVWAGLLGGRRPDWASQAEWVAASLVDVAEQLRVASGLMAPREAVIVRRQRCEWDSTLDGPVLMVVVDEFDRLGLAEDRGLRERAVRDATRIAQYGRKSGVGLVVIAEDRPGAFGHPPVLRASLLHAPDIHLNPATASTT